MVGLSFGADDTYTFSGAVSGNVTWDSYDTVYVNGNITIGSSASLTIEPNTNGLNAGINDNVYIIFTGNYGITISSDGTLITSGTSSDSIIFTADRDNDHSFGESGETWAHISFENTTASDSSIIDYSVFENGYVKNLSGTAGYGGALHINIDKIRISNSEFSNNTAEWGGAIFVNINKGPLIKVCLFFNNESDNGGGGIYCWDGSDASIENCIFDSNKAGYGTTTTYYTGGGVALQSNTDVKLFNCTFVNNDSNHDGNGLQFFGLGGNPNATNCIFWGSSSQVSGGQSTRLTNCAIQGSTSGINTITLNSSNTGVNPYGPYFNATDGTDWSIKVISPCRNAGTDTGAPTTDFNGNSRVGTTDIGAYEVQYNRWKTTASSTTWASAGNWDLGIPTSFQNVVIPTGASNYPTGSSSQDYTIGSGYGMVLDPGAQATLGTLTTTGDLRLRSDASNISSLIINSIDVSAIVDLYLTGGGSPNYKWHYISSPFSASLSITPFSDVTLNLAQFIQSLYSSTTQAWVAYDGYDYGTGMGGPTFSALSSGTGYNFYDNVTNEITISGQLEEDTDVAVGLGFGDNGADYSGFNLLGNPFSSGLDWDVIIDDVSYPANTSKGLYFTRNNVQCTYINYVGVPGDVTGIIPPMQGFFTKTYSTLNTITLLASARTHNSIHARYKGKSTIPLVRLSILQPISSATIGPPLTTYDSLTNDETVVRFDEQAKPGLDYDFDAVKMFLSDDKLSIYSYNGETNYAINGLPFPEGNTEIPLAVTIIEGGDQITISAIQIQRLDNYQITLKDLVTGFNVDLKTADLIFTAPPGTYTNRFLLTISGTTGIEDIHDLPGFFNVFAANNQLNIKTLSDVWNGKSGTVRIFDLTGRTVSEIHNKEFWKNSILQVPAPPAKGIYFVEISSGVMRYVGKVSVVK